MLTSLPLIFPGSPWHLYDQGMFVTLPSFLHVVLIAMLAEPATASDLVTRLNAAVEDHMDAFDKIDNNATSGLTLRRLEVKAAMVTFKELAEVDAGNALAHVRARRDFLSRYRGTVPDPSVDREGYDYAQSELAEADADLAILAAIAAEARSDAAESTARLKDALNELDRARVGVVEGDERFGILKERREVVQSWADASAAMYAAEKAAAANDRTTQSEHLQQAVAAYSQATAADKAGRYMMLERQRDAAAKMADALKAVETEKPKGAVVAPPSGQPPRPKLQDKMWFKWPKIGFGVSAGILGGGSIAAGVLYGVYRSNYAKAATADDATYADIVARNAHVTRGIFTTAVVLVPMAFVGTTVFATLWGKRVRKAKMWGKKLHVTPSAMQIPGGPVYGFFMRF